MRLQSTRSAFIIKVISVAVRAYLLPGFRADIPLFQVPNVSALQPEDRSPASARYSPLVIELFSLLFALCECTLPDVVVIIMGKKLRTVRFGRIVRNFPLFYWLFRANCFPIRS